MAKWTERLRGIPEELAQARKKHEEMLFRLGLMEGDLDLRKSMHNIPEILHKEARARLDDAKKIADNLRKNIDSAGKDISLLNQILAQNVPEVEELMSGIEHTVKRYMDSVESIKRVRDHFKSMKEYWERSKSDTHTFVQRIDRQIDNLERQLKIWRLKWGVLHQHQRGYCHWSPGLKQCVVC